MKLPRTDYDLGRHQEASGKDLTYYDQEKNEHYIPYVICAGWRGS